jgi:dUTP pyrophosphatase
VIVEFIKTHKNAVLPTRAKTGDAGFDLSAIHPGRVAHGERVLVETGLKIAIPAGYVGLVCPRSGLAAQHVSVTNAPGVIDSGYRGDLKVWVEHRGNSGCIPFTWKTGDRLAQFVVVEIPEVVVAEVAEFSEPETERAESGFGSSGIATPLEVEKGEVDKVAEVRVTPTEADYAAAESARLPNPVEQFLEGRQPAPAKKKWGRGKK